MVNNKNKKKVVSVTSLLSLLLDLLLIVTFIFIVIGLYYTYQIKVKNVKYADIFGYSFFEVATGSMKPTINVGDVVVVKITKDVNENDLIVYSDNESLIVHRLIEKNDKKLIAKGDANNSEDKPITEEQILGKVIYILPRIGLIKKIILSPEVLGLILIFIAFIISVKLYVQKPEKKVKDEKANKPNKTSKSSKLNKLDKNSELDKTSKSSKLNKIGKNSELNKTGKSSELEKASKNAKLDKTENTGKIIKNNKLDKTKRKNKSNKGKKEGDSNK